MSSETSDVRGRNTRDSMDDGRGASEADPPMSPVRQCRFGTPALGRAWTTLLGLAFLLGLGGCSIESPFAIGEDGLPEVERDLSAPAQTESLRYTLEAEAGWLQAEIPHVYTNPTGHPVEIVNCNAVIVTTLEKHHAGAWVEAWHPVVSLCSSADIAIEPGAAYQDTLRLAAGFQGTNNGTKFHFKPITGVYRLRWDRVYWDSDSEVQIPTEDRVSNPFVLVDPR